MEHQKTNLSIQFHRIVALWAFIECSLGGLAHAFKLPFTALYVGGGSMFCILLIARYVEAKKIFQALGTVLSIKFLLNPHSPIGAYLAVSFQALLGYVLFRFSPFFRLNVILLFCLGFLESAFQKVLIMSFLYGKNLYKVLDKVLQDFSSLLGLNFLPDTFSLFAVYICFYGLVGLFIGFLLGKYILLLEQKNWQFMDIHTNPVVELQSLPNKGKREKKMYFSVFFLFLLLVFLYFSGEKMSWWGAFLSILAIFFWFSGVLNMLLPYILPKQSSQYQREILDILPQIQHIWHLSKESVKTVPLPRKLFVFLHTFVLNVLFTQIHLPFGENNDK